MEIKPVRRSRADSYEALFHEIGPWRFLLDTGVTASPTS